MPVYATNEDGEIVGRFQSVDGKVHGFLLSTGEREEDNDEEDSTSER